MTAPTLPAMSDYEIARVWISIKDPIGMAKHVQTGDQVRDFARAIIAARDAQWAARHNAWVDGIDKAMAAEVDKLQEEVENLHSVMIAAAEEINEHWQAHCDEEGYGPANLMHRLEKGIPAQYAYKAGDFERLMQERDAAVARLDAAVRAAPVAPTEPTHLRRADGTLSGVFVEQPETVVTKEMVDAARDALRPRFSSMPSFDVMLNALHAAMRVAPGLLRDRVSQATSEAAAVADDLRNWFDFLPGHAQPTVERAVRLLETRP